MTMSALSPYPAWCPDCHESSSQNYPFELPGGNKGCRTCGQVWTPEKLSALRTDNDPTVVSEIIERVVKEVLDRDFNVDPAIVSEATKVQHDLGLDEADAVQLLEKVGDRFNIRFLPAEHETLITVGQTIKAVRSKLGL